MFKNEAHALETNMLLGWASENAPRGPGLVAALAPIGDGDLGELGRSLLVEFGEDDAVRLGLTHMTPPAGPCFPLLIHDTPYRCRERREYLLWWVFPEWGMTWFSFAADVDSGICLGGDANRHRAPELSCLVSLAGADGYQDHSLLLFTELPRKEASE